MFKKLFILIKNFIFGNNLGIVKGDLVEIKPSAHVASINDYSNQSTVSCVKYIDFSRGDDVKIHEVSFFLNRWGEIEERANNEVGKQQFLSRGNVLASMGWMIWGQNEEGEECFLNNYYGRLNTKIGLVLASYKTFWRIERLKIQVNGYMNMEGGNYYKYILYPPINWYCILIGQNQKIWINDKMCDFKKL